MVSRHGAPLRISVGSEHEVELRLLRDADDCLVEGRCSERQAFCARLSF